MLGVRGPRQIRVAVEQRTAVERREQPLVRVDDEGVAAFDPDVPRTHGWGRQPGTAVRTINMQPEAELLADVGDGGQVVDDPEVRRAGGRDDGEEVLGPFGLQHGPQIVTREAPVLDVHRDQLGVHDIAR